MSGSILNNLMLKVGKVDIARMGFRAREESAKSNRSFTASQNGDVFDCSVKDPDLDSEDRTFTVYCIGTCSLMRAFQLKKRLDDELNEAILNGGHMQFERSLQDYHARWELLGGTTNEKDIVSQYGVDSQGRRVVILDLTVTLRKSIPPFSLSFGPSLLRNTITDAEWLADDPDEVGYTNIKALLVTTGTSVPDEQADAITLSDFSDLHEYTSDSYEEQSLTKRTVSIWTPPFGPDIKGYTCADIRFPTLDNDDSGDAIEGLVIATEDDTFLGYIDKTTWTHIVGYPNIEDGAFMPNGNTVIFRPSADGLLRVTVVV